MRTTLRTSLLLALFGTTLAVTTPATAAKKDKTGNNNNTGTTEAQETSSIPEICHYAIRKNKKGRVYDHHDCEVLLEEQAQQIQNLLTESRTVSDDIDITQFLGSCWPYEAIDPIEGFCTQLVDTHASLGMDPVSAWYMCKQGMIWQVDQIVAANLVKACTSMRAVWASSWPNDYW